MRTVLEQKRTCEERLNEDRMITEDSSGKSLNEDRQSTEGDQWSKSE